mgnify:CR=1 FL=1
MRFAAPPTPASTETTTPASEPASTSSWEPPPLPTETPAIKNLGISPPDDKPWASMSYDEKEWYMVGKVHPVMRAASLIERLDQKPGQFGKACHSPARRSAMAGKVDAD